MMLGELDYNEMFYSQDELYDSQDRFQYQDRTYSGKLKPVVRPQLFPVTAQVFITIFIIFVSIVIVNFLFGLAVYDVQVSLVILSMQYHYLSEILRLITFHNFNIFTPFISEVIRNSGKRHDFESS